MTQVKSFTVDATCTGYQRDMVSEITHEMNVCPELSIYLNYEGAVITSTIEVSGVTKTATETFSYDDVLAKVIKSDCVDNEEIESMALWFVSEAYFKATARAIAA